MGWWSEVAERWRALTDRSTAEREMEEEFRFHLEMEARQLEEAGHDPEEARRIARLRFGGIERMKERTRDERGIRLLEEAWSDLRFAVRSLRKDPGFALAGLLTLALGVGAMTALFSVVHGVLLRPLPYDDADRLVMMKERTETGRTLMASYPNFDDWRSQAERFAGMLAVQFASRRPVIAGGRARRVPVQAVSREFFEVLATGPVRGRAFLPGENAPGGEPVVVVSHRLWRDLLGSPESLEGVTLTLGSGVARVVGVMPPGFRLLEEADVWTPLEQAPVEIRSAHNYWVVGRLAAGATVEGARSEMNELAARLKAEWGKEMSSSGVEVRPLHEEVVGSVRRPLLLLFAAAGLVLLIASTNIAGNLLARGTSRRRELGIRAALGASGGRLLRQLAVESLALAVAGTAVGVGVALGIVDLLRSLGGGMIPRLEGVAVDGTVLAFAGGLAILTALLFGIYPALRQSRDVESNLRPGARGSSARTGTGPWRTLVAGEVALALLLLAGTALLLRSFANIVTLDTGFRRDRILTAAVPMPVDESTTEEDVLAFWERAGRDLEAIPGVRSAGFVNRLPLDAGTQTGPVVEPPVADPTDRDVWKAIAGWRVVSPGYFDVLDIHLQRGRTFSPADAHGDAGVAVVNEALARRVWPDEDPIGKRIQALWDRRGEALRVVGVVAEARRWDREEGAQPEIFVSALQRPEHATAMYAVLRTGPAPEAVAGQVRRRIESLDPRIPVEIETLEGRMDASLADRRFTLWLLGGFGAVALALAVVGIYGVVSYQTGLRRREIGIRLAIGAAPADVRRGVLAGALRPVALGVAAGLTGALALGRLVQGLLFDLPATDPLSLGAAALALLGVGVLAAWIPARRSSRLDPVRVLRVE